MSVLSSTAARLASTDAELSLKQKRWTKKLMKLMDRVDLSRKRPVSKPAIANELGCRFWHDCFSCPMTDCLVGGKYPSVLRAMGVVERSATEIIRDDDRGRLLDLVEFGARLAQHFANQPKVSTPDAERLYRYGFASSIARGAIHAIIKE